MFERIIDKLDKQEQQFEQLPALGKGYEGVPLSMQNFHELEAKPGELCAVDAGFAELISASNYSIALLRTAAVIGSKPTIREWHCLAYCTREDGKLVLKCELEPNSRNAFPIKEFSLSPYDSSYSEGNRMVKLSRVIEQACRIAELSTTIVAAKSLKQGTVLVRDGTLEEEELEKELFNNLYATGVPIVAVAKSSVLLAESGASISSLLLKNGPKEAWLYHPLFSAIPSTHRAEIYFVKLHQRSSFCFRCELHNAEGSLAAVAANSSDLSFPGYPFYLMNADRYARVSFSEVSLLRTALASRLKSRQAADAHEILNQQI